MRGLIALVLALICAAIAGGLMLVPGSLERISMLTRDRLYDAALAEANRAAGHGDPMLLLRAVELNDRYGDPDTAAAALEAYLALRPHDVAGWKRAVSLYEGSYRLAPLMRALEHLIAIESRTEHIDHLLRLLRLHGRFADERRVLLRLRPEARTLAHRERLAGLLMADGDMDGALAILRQLDEEAAPGIRAPRMLLFNLLLGRGEFAEAAGRAARWLPAWESAEIRSQCLRLLVRAGAGEFALNLALDQSGGPGSLADLVYVLDGEGRPDLTRDAVAHWLRRAGTAVGGTTAGGTGGSSFDEAAELAVSRGMPELVAAELFATLRQGRDPRLAAALADALFSNLGYSVLAVARPLLTYEMLAARPLLGARLSLTEENPLAARHFLLSADLTALSPREASQWRDIAPELFSERDLLAMLMERWQAGQLPAEIRGLMLDLALKAGASESARRLWASLAAEKPSGPTAHEAH
jgi:hypothetical protein